MRIGVLGAGRMGQSVARRLYAAGYDVRIGVREPDRIGPVFEGCRIVSFEAAIGSADIVVLALPWSVAWVLLQALAPLLKSTAVVLDCTNPTADDYRDGKGLTGTTGAERLASVVGPCRLVKALNHVPADLLDSAPLLPITPTAFYCGGNTAAKQLVASVLRKLWLRPVDAGSIESARALEAISELIFHFVRQGTVPSNAVALQLWTDRIEISDAPSH